MIGQTISHYKILEKLGEGGMGVVYKAQDINLDRIVALKFLPRQSILTKQDTARFTQEAQAAARLNHPNAATIYEFDEVRNPISGEMISFIAMEFVNGVTLTRKIEEGQFRLEEGIRVARTVAEALSKAHSLGIVHRDIKSDNIMIANDGSTKVMDFGLAAIAGRSRLTKSGTTLGTAAYMSPEQAKGEAVDHRTDIWSLGIVLYEMFSGRHPFRGDYDQALMYQIVNVVPPSLISLRSGIPVELELVVTKALEKDPENRYQHLDEMLVDLRDAQSLIEGNGDSGSSKSKRNVRPRTLRTTLIASGVLIVLAVAVIMIFMSRRINSSPQTFSIAVLPLGDRSQNHDQDWFIDGISESIIADLAKVPGLLVKAHGSVVQFKGKALDVKEVANTLQVRYVLAGDVLRLENRLRIMVQLIDASNGSTLWGGNFGGIVSVINVFAIQDSIARKISDELKIALRPNEQTRHASIPTQNMRAFDLYLRGRFYARRENRADIDSAISNLQQAVALDGSFASAYAQLARGYNLKAFYYAAEKRELQIMASTALDKALALNPDLAEAHMVRGLMLFTHASGYPFEEAVKEFRRALSLDPNMDEAHHQLGTVYGHIGLWDKGFKELQQALSINPANTMARFRLGVYHTYRQEYKESLSQLEDIPRDFNPSLWGYQTSWAIYHLGRIADARARITDCLRISKRDEGGVLTAMQALIAATDGDSLLTNELIRSAIKKGEDFGHFHHTAFVIGCCYALMHDVRHSVEWLRRASQDGFPCYPAYEKEPTLNNIRAEAEFITFMRDFHEKWDHLRATV